jgi:hypothetical protein
MGSSDPLPAGFEIQFGSLNFQAMGNGYLMRISNRAELHPWWPTGPGPVPATPAAVTPAPAPPGAAGPSASRHRRCSSQRSRRARTERRRAARAMARRDALFDKTTPVLVGKTRLTSHCSPTGCVTPQRPTHRPLAPMWRPTTTPPGYHLLVTRNLIATNDESYHGSASELRPATSHGYAE